MIKRTHETYKHSFVHFCLVVQQFGVQPRQLDWNATIDASGDRRNERGKSTSESALVVGISKDRGSI